MIVRTLHDQPTRAFPGGMTGKVLVHEDDGMGYSLIDVAVDAQCTQMLTSPYVAQPHTQVVYCISGHATLEIGRSQLGLTHDHVIAFDGQSPFRLRTHSGVRMAWIYSLTTATHAIITRSLEQIVGTERDVFWGNGQSRRFLVKHDGVGIALCNTIGNANTDSLLEYKNHYESCYYIEGSGEYEWHDGKHPILTNDGQGTVFIMNARDRHNMRIEQTAICISIFSPPIDGHECHQLDMGNASCY